MGSFGQGVQVLAVQKGCKPDDGGQIEFLFLLALQIVVHQPLHVSGREDRGEFLDFFHGDGFVPVFGGLVFLDDAVQGLGGAFRAQELVHADMKDLAELFQFGDVRTGGAPLPVGDGLIADRHGIRQVHLRHVLGNPCFSDFMCYFHSIEHDSLLSVWRCSDGLGSSLAAHSAASAFPQCSLIRW